MKKSAAVAIIIAVIALIFAANPEYFNNLDESGRRVLIALIPVLVISIRTIKQKIDENIEESYREIQKKK